MTSRIKNIAAALIVASSAIAGSAWAQNQLLNVSYDVAREFYKDYNAAFVAHYKKTTGKDVKIDQAHGGSSAQARAVAAVVGTGCGCIGHGPGITSLWGALNGHKVRGLWLRPDYCSQLRHSGVI